MEQRLAKLKALRDKHFAVKHGLTLYPYQQEVSDAIIQAVITNLEIAADSTPEQVENLVTYELGVEFARQSGKTTTVVHTIEFMMIFLPVLYKCRLNFILGAPQTEQFKTDFDRLKEALMKSRDDLLADWIYEEEAEVAREQSNARNLVLPNGAAVYVLPINVISKIESKSAHAIFIEEAQDVNDNTMTTSIFPMGSTTNAPRFLIGTAGTRLCYFHKLVKTGNALVYPWRQIADQRRQTYIKTRDARHLIYEQYVKAEMAKFGEDSDEFRRPYNLEWLIGTGQFTTKEALDGLVNGHSRTFHEKINDCYAGIDTAKHPDSTVLTVLRYNHETRRKEVLNWLELRGENYKDQFDIIQDFLKRYKVVAVAIDSTGQGDFMPDMFERETNWRDENSGLFRVKFSAVSKDILYKNLKVSISELLTALPKLDTREGGRFLEQMIYLEQEYKGQLLSVHHPDTPDAHDDYPDSWALAEYAYARWNENRVEMHIVDATPKREEELHEAFWSESNPF